MGYGRLGSTVLDESPSNNATSATRKSSSSASSSKKLKFLVICAITLIVASGISVAVLVVLRTKASGDSRAHSHRAPTQAMSRACSKTRYPTLCVNSLLDFPGSTAASAADLVHLSVNMTLQHFGRALYMSSGISNMQMDALTRAAYEDCLELLDDSVEHLTRSLTSVEKSGGSTSDVMTWLSAALTNQDTCSEGLEGASGEVKDQMANGLKDLSELVSNCLAIFAASNDDDDFSGVPIQNKRKLLGDQDVDELIYDDPHHPSDIIIPKWLSRRDRRLLDAPISAIQADIVVSGSGNGSVKTITEAIKKAPEQSGRRFIIYVKAGKYQEDNLKVGRKKTNLMFIGDGKGKTVISGGKNVFEKLTTFRTASFAATGAGFIARDISFENFAGPSKHQAVALRVGADHAVIYRCNIIGYQDTLYVHSQRQFYRECDIYGTVDFIFGNAAVVFQHCSIYARKPMPMQKNTITAQNRKDPNQNTGISIHACRIVATADLAASKGSIQTFLGRPWKLYSRTVYLLSYMGDHIHPRGWLEWDGTFALDTLYYGEYMNSGPGGAVGSRVKWPGYRVITSPVEAGKYTVGQFIFGSAWLPPTGVAFVAGLSE